MDVSALVVRVAHILCGVAWAGAAVMIAVFVEPAVVALGPDGGKFMQRIMGPGRFPTFMTGVGSVTALSGVALLWTSSGGRPGDWFASRYGWSIVVGSVLGLAGMMVGMLVNAPTARRAAALGHEIQTGGKPPTPVQSAELMRLQGRLHVAARVAAALLVLSVVFMAAAHEL